MLDFSLFPPLRVITSWTALVFCARNIYDAEKRFIRISSIRPPFLPWMWRPWEKSTNEIVVDGVFPPPNPPPWGSPGGQKTWGRGKGWPRFWWHPPSPLLCPPRHPSYFRSFRSERAPAPPASHFLERLIGTELSVALIEVEKWLWQSNTLLFLVVLTLRYLMSLSFSWKLFSSF